MTRETAISPAFAVGDGQIGSLVKACQVNKCTSVAVKTVADGGTADGETPFADNSKTV